MMRLFDLANQQIARKYFFYLKWKDNAETGPEQKQRRTEKQAKAYMGNSRPQD